MIVDISLEKLDKPYTYRIPENLIDTVSAGTPVMVPFGPGGKLRRGYVVNVSDTAAIEDSRIKDIARVASRTLGADEEFLELALWMKEYCGCTFNKALRTVLPVSRIVRKKASASVKKAEPLSYRLHTLNEEQKAAFDRFTEDYDAGRAGTYLLFGVTGSGKTDTYIHMIRHVIASGKKAVLLIPEISLTYQTIERIRAVFGDRIAVLHSKLSQGERYEEIRKCLEGEADIMVGPRSAIFTPFDHIGLIVIDEEHDGAYKNENTPRYDTRTVALRRAMWHKASVVLASATPSPESYGSALNGEYTLLKLSKRAVPEAVMPQVEVIDMREELRMGNRSIFSARLTELIQDRLSRKEQVILFMNRRGYSSFMSCRSCGEAVRCPHCDISLTVHTGRRLICHYCGYETKEPDKCPSCGSPYIAEFGCGTQKLEKMTQKLFPEARVARLDTDSASRKNTSEDILHAFRSKETDILIGTQMVVKGHDYPNVTLVGIMAADTSLYVSNYNSGERTFELITQAAGRAGRGERPGNVVIQTYKPEHYAISSAASADYEDYFTHEMAFRSILAYPPAVHIWTVQLSSKNEPKLDQYASDTVSLLHELSKDTGTQILGPVKPSVYRINDYYRKIIYIKNADYDILIQLRDHSEAVLKDTEGEISVMYDLT